MCTRPLILVPHPIMVLFNEPPVIEQLALISILFPTNLFKMRKANEFKISIPFISESSFSQCNTTLNYAIASYDTIFKNRSIQDNRIFAYCAAVSYDNKVANYAIASYDTIFKNRSIQDNRIFAYCAAVSYDNKVANYAIAANSCYF